MVIGSKNGMTAGLWLASAVALLALPSAVLAFATDFEPHFRPGSTGGSMEPIDQETPPQRLARAIPVRSLAKGTLYPFTPAGTANRPDRSVTVAVRVDSGAPQLIYVRGMRAPRVADAGILPLRISPNAFNLGVSRGYHGFAQGLVPPVEARKLDLSELGDFSIASTASSAGSESRLSPRIIVDEKQAAGRAPRTFGGEGAERLDVGGSYRVTRNLNVTAGVRYQREDRERLHPLTDGKQDNQAVYVGTQFRF